MGGDTTKAGAGEAESFAPVPVRWEQLQPELRSHGILVQRTLQDLTHRDFLGQFGDPSYAAIMRSDGAENSLDMPGMIAMFNASGMTIVDLATIDGDISRDFCAWFDYSERTGPLQAVVTADQIEGRLASLASELGRCGWSINYGMIDGGSGPHGCLTARAHRHPDGAEDEIALDLGPWGWTKWEQGIWEESRSYATEMELEGGHLQIYIKEPEASDLGITVTIESPSRPCITAVPPEWEYHFITIPVPLEMQGYGPSWPEVVVAACTAYTFAPFIQAFMAKAGEDCYQALRGMISRHGHKDEYASIIDKETDSELVFQAPLPDEALRQLAMMNPKLLRRRTTAWNQESAAWEISRELRPSKPRRPFKRIPPT
jgi:hypothetical protein